MNIQILGGGCKKCEKLLNNVKQAVATANIEADIEYITDMEAIAKAGLMITPGLIIDGEIKSTGRVPSAKKIKDMITKQ